MSGDGDKKGGGKGHPVKGRNIAKQWAAIFAKGHIRKGKDGKGKYSRSAGSIGERLRAVGARTGAQRGGATRHNHNTSAVNRAGKGGNRPVIGGKAAHLRGSGTGGKPNHSATRAARLAAGRAIANRPEVARKALKGSGLRVTEHKDKGPRILGAGAGPLRAVGKKTNMAGDTRFLVQTARKNGQLKPRWSSAGGKPTREQRIQAGRKAGGKFFESDAGRRAQAQIPVFMAVNSGNKRAALSEFNALRRKDAARAARSAETIKRPDFSERSQRIHDARMTLGVKNPKTKPLIAEHNKFTAQIRKTVTQPDGIALQGHEARAIKAAWLKRRTGTKTPSAKKTPAPAPKPKVDHSATRAARVAEGKQLAHDQLERLRTITSGSRRQSVTNLRNYRDNPTWTAHMLTDNKSDTLSEKRLKKIYSSVGVAARSTNARQTLKRYWTKRN